MDKFFKLKENNTTVGTELMAGLTTFLTMAYIMFVNPNILSLTGMPKPAVFIATILAAAIGTLVMGLFANVPFAQAPGMGLNAFFTFTVCFAMGFNWQQALAMVFICGLINILITVTKIRKMIINAIPESLQYAISGGIGMFIFYIGLINAGFLNFIGDKVNMVFGSDASNVYKAVVPELAKFDNKAILIALAGLIIIVVLMLLKVKAAILIGIISSTILALATGLSVYDPSIDLGGLAAIGETFLKLDFQGLFADPGKLLLVFTTIFAFSLTDTFDTIGTFLGTGRKTGIFDEEDEKDYAEGSGFSSKLDRALFADATATSIGALLGTSNTTTYVESAAGIAVGGKTGLTAVTTAVLFLCSLVLMPFVSVVPSVATAPALIVVGILMAESIGKINWSELEEAIPSFFTMAMMPLSYSITNGVSTGFIFYCLAMLVTGKGKKVHPIMYIVTLLFILSMVLNVIVK
ncbi:NCS2 family permease [Guggenheimella bovis]